MRTWATWQANPPEVTRQHEADIDTWHRGYAWRVSKAEHLRSQTFQDETAIRNPDVYRAKPKHVRTHKFQLSQLPPGKPASVEALCNQYSPLQLLVAAPSFVTPPPCLQARKRDNHTLKEILSKMRNERLLKKICRPPMYERRAPADCPWVLQLYQTGWKLRSSHSSRPQTKLHNFQIVDHFPCLVLIQCRVDAGTHLNDRGRLFSSEHLGLLSGTHPSRSRLQHDGCMPLLLVRLLCLMPSHVFLDPNCSILSPQSFVCLPSQMSCTSHEPIQETVRRSIFEKKLNGGKKPHKDDQLCSFKINI